MTLPSVAQQAGDNVTLANCADEAIHIPGSIQPHGALLVFDAAAQLVFWSANAAALLLVAPAFSATPEGLGLAGEVCAMIADCLAEMLDGDGEVSPLALETSIGEVRFDCITHAHQRLVLVEFEQRDQPSDMVAAFALKAHSAIDRLKRQKSVDALLQMATQQIRAITGFDRVMGYHFRQDDSGDVAAEACREDLEPYLGRRYPASDIPAQARRLYLINTLRLICDVGYAPMPVLGRADAAPLDMSHAVLRSVSPIHIEYLKNMGVGASMSVSIVVNGRLWGLIACHHMTARQVPYSIRMAADVIAQVLASTVQSLEAKLRGELIERSAQVRTRMMETLLHHDDVLKALAAHADGVCDSLACDTLLISHYGRIHVHGELDAALAARIIATLPDSGEELVRREALDDWPAGIRPALGKWVGMLALRFDPAANGWLVSLRREQIEAVCWAGYPEKLVAHGPFGPRLTPRGSFEEWRETVRDRAEPWDETRIIIARQLLAEMHRASVARHIDTERARGELMAMLGHDLRGPLHSINMATEVLAMGGAQLNVTRRIQSSSGRMQRLISQVLDMSRINGGLRLRGQMHELDLLPLLRDLVDEYQTANPAIAVVLELATPLAPDPVTGSAAGAPLVRADGDRLAQVVSNLLSNAGFHGVAGQPVIVRLGAESESESGLDSGLDSGPEWIRLEVRNHGEPIAPDLAAHLYQPFKRTTAANTRNRDGLGLGLYIAHQIVVEHGGSIAYSFDNPQVVFTVLLPRAQTGAAEIPDA